MRENASVASAPISLELATLGIALWGAGFSTYLGVVKRRRRLLVSAEWGTDRLGSSRNHVFFIVSVVNTGERAVAVREVEWVLDEAEELLREIREEEADQQDSLGGSRRLVGPSIQKAEGCASGMLS